jgi:cytochrome c-type biogenesis protein CcmF
MTLAHAGVAVLMMGMIGSTGWKSEEIVFAAPGTEVTIAGFDITFEGAAKVQGPNYIADRGTLVVRRDGELVTTLFPERRYYPVAESQTTESAIRSTLAGDLYTSIATPASDQVNNAGAWTLRILYEPLVNLIWIGSILLVIGGCLSLSDRRLRVGAPRRAKQPATDAVPAE